MSDYDDCSPKDRLLGEAEVVRGEIESLKNACKTLCFDELAKRLEWIEQKQKTVWRAIAHRCDVRP